MILQSHWIDRLAACWSNYLAVSLWQGTIVFALVLTVLWLWRSSSPRWRYGLLYIALIKFAFPAIGLFFGLFSVIPSPIPVENKGGPDITELDSIFFLPNADYTPRGVFMNDASSDRLVYRVLGEFEKGPDTAGPFDISVTTGALKTLNLHSTNDDLINPDEGYLYKRIKGMTYDQDRSKSRRFKIVSSTSSREEFQKALSQELGSFRAMEGAADVDNERINSAETGGWAFDLDNERTTTAYFLFRPSTHLAIHLLGVLLFLLFLYRRVRLINQWRLSGQLVSDSSLFYMVQDIARGMGLKQTPAVYLLDREIPPLVCGVFRPFILLPRWSESLEYEERRVLLTHEIAHIRRRDPFANMIQAFFTCWLWWNPLVVFLNRQIKHARELCCDDMTIVSGHTDSLTYSRALLKAVERMVQHDKISPAMGLTDNFIAINDRLNRMLNTEIHRSISTPPATKWGLLTVAALVFFGSSSIGAEQEAAFAASIQKANRQVIQPRRDRNYLGQENWPRITHLFPAPNETGIDPDIPHITIVFDRPMKKTYSLINMGSAPPIYKVEWLDERTCRAWVMLEPERVYRLFVNYKTVYNKFESLHGSATLPYEWKFRTRTKSESTRRYAHSNQYHRQVLDEPAGEPLNHLGQSGWPKISALDPPAGAEELEPGERVFTVKFDRPMRPGQSWVDMGRAPEITNIQWIDRQTCQGTAVLKPGKAYEIWLNHGKHNSLFRSEAGISSKRFLWRFSTAKDSD